MKHYIVIMMQNDFDALSDLEKALFTDRTNRTYASEEYAIRISAYDLNSLKAAYPQYDPVNANKRYHTALISED